MRSPETRVIADIIGWFTHPDESDGPPSLTSWAAHADRASGVFLGRRP